MRDLLFTTLFAAMAVLSVRYAHLGVMLWVWSALLPPNSYLYGFGRDIPFNKIAVACTLIGLVIDRRKRIGLDPILLVMALFLLQVSLSLTAAPTPEAWGAELYERLIKVVIAAFALRFVAIDRPRLHAILVAMCLAVATGTLAEAGKVVLSGGGHHTIGPPSWGDENSSATMVLMFMPLYLHLGAVATHPLLRRLRLPVFGGGVLAVIGSFSRGGFIGLLALALSLLVSARRRGPVIAGLMLLGGIGYGLAPDQWVNRIETTRSAHEDASFMGRVFQWKILTLMALDHPVMGAGMLANMDPSLWLFYADRLESELTLIPAPRSDGPHASHSIYFQVLGETGFVGLGLFLGMFGLGLRAAGRIRAETAGHPEWAWAGEMASALRLGLILFLLTGAALPIPYFEPAYLLLAALAALHSLHQRQGVTGRAGLSPRAPLGGARPQTSPVFEKVMRALPAPAGDRQLVLLPLILAGLIALGGSPADGGEFKPGTLRRAADGTLVLDPPPPARSEAPTPPPPPPVRRAEPAPRAGGDGGPARTLAVCPDGCAHSSLGAALQAARDGDTVTLAPGLYRQGGVIRVDRVTLKAQPGAHLTGAAVAGKAALVITGADTRIEGLECSAIAVPDGNGACVRLEGQGLTLRRVHFHDAQQGVLATGSGGEITIEDSLFERLGQGGRAHALYVNRAALLTIRRSAILAGQGEGHEVKSRAARTVIEDSLLASFEGVDSRLLDLPNGGEGVIRNSVLEKGPNSSNGEMIGFGLEGIAFERNSLTLDHVTALIDRPGGRLLNGGGLLTVLQSRVIGGTAQPQTAEIWVRDRASAGLAPYPWVPSTPTPAAILAADPPPRREKRVCLGGGCDYLSLATALREATSGSTLVLATGTYFEAGVLRANGVTLRAEPGAMIKGVAAEGKAALVIKGENTVIEGLECGFITVADGNGACVRLEGKGLTLRRVYFHDSEQGLLANDGNGAILIEDSRFERLGKGGRAHGLYVGTGTSLTLRRSRVTDGRGQGHAVKSRSARTLIEASTLATLTGADSRLLDIALGGELIVRDSLLEKGPGSDNAEMIGFGLEGRPYPLNRIVIDNTLILFDRHPNRLMRSPVHGAMTGGMVVASDEGGVTRRIGALLDPLLPGRVGSNLSVTDVRWVNSRREAGVPAFPDLPPLPPSGEK